MNFTSTMSGQEFQGYWRSEPHRTPGGRWVIVAFVGLFGLSCGDESGPGRSLLDFQPATVDFAHVRDTTVIVTNSSQRAAGPVELVMASVRNGSNNPVVGPTVAMTPNVINTLNPGQFRAVQVSVTIPGTVPDGQYRATISANSLGLGPIGTFDLTFEVAEGLIGDTVDVVNVASGPLAVRQGDVATYTATARDANGSTIGNIGFDWSINPVSVGFINRDGRMVIENPGAVQVIARAGNAADTVDVTVTPRNLSGSFNVVSHGDVSDRFTSDLWINGTTLYSGTWGTRQTSAGPLSGNTLYAWDISNPTAITLTDSVTVDARVVNDVKVRDDGSLAVITHESSTDGLNGVTLLDLSDPQHPSVLRRFSQSLTTGVHNVWLDGVHAYLVVDGGAPSSGLRVLDLSTPASPLIVSNYYAGASFLHDVYVRDGLAFLSHWNAGLVILDVGHGVAGGAPDNPVEVSRIEIPGGQTHNAWYWPAEKYVFVGEEDSGTPGIMHVIDVSNLTNPVRVATFAVPGDTPHNFWLDETAGILYMAWYENGLQALDVTGGLMGPLDRQGRTIAESLYTGSAGACFQSLGTGTCNWAPQLHQGMIYVSDSNTGIWGLELVINSPAN